MFIFPSEITPVFPGWYNFRFMQLLCVAIDLNDPLTHSLSLSLWSGLFPVITLISGLSRLWKQKICDYNPRKTETSCSLPPKPPPHGWAEGTISGLPSVWGGWHRTSVGLEGFRGIRIIAGANFLHCRGKYTFDWRRSTWVMLRRSKMYQESE